MRLMGTLDVVMRLALSGMRSCDLATVVSSQRCRSLFRCSSSALSNSVPCSMAVSGAFCSSMVNDSSSLRLYVCKNGYVYYVGLHFWLWDHCTIFRLEVWAYHSPFDVVEFVLESLPGGLSREYGALKSSRAILGDISEIVGYFSQRPPGPSCPVGKVVPQVIEGEILDRFPLVPGTLHLERAEPVVDPFFRQTLAALRGKHEGPCCVASGLQVRIERLASLVQQIYLTLLAPIMSHMEPSLPGTHVGMGHLQPGELAHAAARPIAQGEEGCSTLVFCLLNQRTQDKALLLRELLKSGQRHGGKLDAAGRVALEQPLLLDQKLGKIADARFHARPVVKTQTFLL